MEIPHVKTLKEDYLKNNKEKLEKVLKDRKNNRSNWTEEKIKKYNYDLIKLKEAHNNIVFEIKKDIIKQAKLHVPNKVFKIMNPQYIDSIDTNKFDVDSVYKGFYNPKRKLFNRLIHYEAGIEKTPFEQIRDEMKEFGYILNDISDITLSKNVLIEVELDY
tara:strand:- start:2299 stop:2781 length:483 start_codon:yes stop_codon:yes gene_type:complete